MDDLQRFCCLNPDCQRYGQRGQGNIAARARYGRRLRRLLYCKACLRRFSERKGTPLFACRLDEDKARSVLAHLHQGCGVRQTERLLGVHRDTVMRLGRLAGDHAKAAHGDLAGFSPSTRRLQLDEKWSFVHKKEKHCRPDLDEGDLLNGDQWDLVALDPDSRLVLSVVVGKRLADNAVLLLEGVRDRLGGRVPERVASDEYPAYAEALLEVFGVEQAPPRTGKPGRPPGPRVVPPEGMGYGTVHKTRQKGGVVKVEARAVLGGAPPGAVSTSYLERQNATDRHRNARKGRRTYRFSKDWGAHEALTYYTMYSYNFCWPVRALRE